MGNDQTDGRISSVAVDERSEPIRVVYEDNWLLAVSKPAGLPVHGDKNGRDLEAILRAKWRRELVLYHRLDQDTTGIVLLGKRADINRAMSEAFENKRIRKCYMAVVRGRWKSEWSRVESFIDRDISGRLVNRDNPPGKKSITTFRILSANDEKSWVEALLKTGRTHQIRLHCLAKGCPILGDRIYGGEATFHDSDESANSPPQALHAYRVSFTHPATGEQLDLTAEPPQYWRDFWLKGFDSSKLETLLKRSQ